MKDDLPDLEMSPEQIVQVRKQLKLTQERFAQSLGISVSTVRNWEQGARKPESSALVLLKLVESFGQEILDKISSARRK